MRLELITVLQYVIIAFISYVISITFSGWFESFIAKKVGDDAPEEAGFLTLNPLEHFNVFGFAAVLWGIFFIAVLPIQLIPGWGRYIPLIPDNIKGSYYKVRIFIEYISKSCAHLLLFIVFSVTLLCILQFPEVYLLQMMIQINKLIVQHPIISLMVFLCYQNLVLFIIHFVLGLFKYVLYFYMPKVEEFSFVTMLTWFVAIFIGLMIFGRLLESFAFNILFYIRLILLSLVK